MAASKNLHKIVVKLRGPYQFKQVEDISSRVGFEPIHEKLHDATELFVWEAEMDYHFRWPERYGSTTLILR